MLSLLIYVSRPCCIDRAQHLAGLELIAELCQGVLTGNAVGSTEIWLQPGILEGGNFTADPKTAGCAAILELLQWKRQFIVMF